jgi:hypothetical protein
VKETSKRLGMGSVFGQRSTIVDISTGVVDENVLGQIFRDQQRPQKQSIISRKITNGRSAERRRISELCYFVMTASGAI